MEEGSNIRRNSTREKDTGRSKIVTTTTKRQNTTTKETEDRNHIIIHRIEKEKDGRQKEEDIIEVEEGEEVQEINQEGTTEALVEDTRRISGVRPHLEEAIEVIMSHVEEEEDIVEEEVELTMEVEGTPRQNSTTNREAISQRSTEEEI